MPLIIFCLILLHIFVSLLPDCATSAISRRNFLFSFGGDGMQNFREKRITRVVLVERVEITIMASKPEEVTRGPACLADTVILQWPVTLFARFRGDISLLIQHA